MNKGWIVFLVLVATGASVYLYYRSQRKTKPIITIPALAPTLTPTPSWLEAPKGLLFPPLQMPSPPLVAPTLTPEEKELAEELGVSEYTVRKFKQVVM